LSGSNFARGLVLAQTLKRGLAYHAVTGPAAKLDLGH
jgi:hypothetical protein